MGEVRSVRLHLSLITTDGSMLALAKVACKTSCTLEHVKDHAGKLHVPRLQVENQDNDIYVGRSPKGYALSPQLMEQRPLVSCDTLVSP
jgi:hypothetical protein